MRLEGGCVGVFDIGKHSDVKRHADISYGEVLNERSEHKLRAGMVLL